MLLEVGFGGDGQFVSNPNGWIYFNVTGFDGQTYLKTTEVLHFDEGQWNLCGSMNYRRLGGGVGVISLNNAPPVPELINSVKH